VVCSDPFLLPELTKTLLYFRYLFSTVIEMGNPRFEKFTHHAEQADTTRCLGRSGSRNPEPRTRERDARGARPPAHPAGRRVEYSGPLGSPAHRPPLTITTATAAAPAPQRAAYTTRPAPPKNREHARFTRQGSN